jgi:hypothetical protein
MKLWLSGAAFGLALTATIIAPQRNGRAEESECPADKAWVDSAEKFDSTEPSEKTEECPFYQRAWAAFLHVTREGTNNSAPVFLQEYETFRSLFLKQKAARLNGESVMILSIRTPENPTPVFDGGIDQARSSAVIDRNGNPIFYSIEIDPVFSDFIRKNKLDDKKVVRSAFDADIENGSIEIKSAWQIVEDEAAYKNYITTKAMVPALKQDGDQVHSDPSAPMRPATVALLGIHVVFKIQNHPELIWATFEHIGNDREFDLAPRAAGFPPAVDPNANVAAKDYTLYRANTTYDQGNQQLRPMTLLPDGHIKERSSIYRAYPWSQVKTKEGEIPAEDDDVAAVNKDMLDIFQKNYPNDLRQNYKLVGTVWLKNGAADFHVGHPIKNEDLLGERGLSNMAIESMTQEDFTHCFVCHRPTKGAGMPAKKINVSHLFEMFSNSP